MYHRNLRRSVATTFVTSLMLAIPAHAATPTVQQALGLTPIQSDIDYETPTGAATKQCALKAVKESKHTGWEVFGPEGQLLRRFLDSNRDKRIDQWCYYLRGLEVYRDIDTDFNGKADQYRWLGTGGSRWGLDKDEDGSVDQWKMISPEEVTAEVVAAIRDRNSALFDTVLLGRDELARLGLGTSQTADLRKRVLAAKAGFRKYAREQQTVRAKSRWLHFGATRPGIVPEGTEGSTKDLLIYDNVAAVVEEEGRHKQLIVGTLIHVGDGWRVIDLPQSDSSAGFFTSISGTADQQEVRAADLDQSMQELLSKLEKVDAELSTATKSGLSSLNAERAGVLEQLATQAATPQERNTWMRQFADSVSAAAQSGDYPQGPGRLRSVQQRLKSNGAPEDLQAYVQFRYLTADYGRQLQEPEADFAKIQEKWLENLDNFVSDFPRQEDAAEAMLQLAIAKEFAGKDKEAIGWYRRIIRDFSSGRLAAKAAGAKKRLESVGRSISLKGESIDGKSIDLTRYRGRAVLIHYWATWCEPCKKDLKTIRQLQARLPSDKFAAIGVNLDSQRRTAVQYLKSNRLPWPQLHEDGGLDSRLANELGILTLPTMILVDKKGRVVRRNIHAGELDAEVKKLVK